MGDSQISQAVDSHTAKLASWRFFGATAIVGLAFGVFFTLLMVIAVSYDPSPQAALHGDKVPLALFFVAPGFWLVAIISGLVPFLLLRKKHYLLEPKIGRANSLVLGALFTPLPLAVIAMAVTLIVSPPPSIGGAIVAVLVILLMIAPAALVSAFFLRKSTGSAEQDSDMLAPDTANVRDLEPIMALREKNRMMTAIGSASMLLPVALLAVVYFLISFVVFGVLVSGEGDSEMLFMAVAMLLPALLSMLFPFQAAFLTYLPRWVTYGFVMLIVASAALFYLIYGLMTLASLPDMIAKQGMGGAFLLVGIVVLSIALGVFILSFIAKATLNLWQAPPALHRVARGAGRRSVGFGAALRSVIGVPAYVSDLPSGRTGVTFRFALAALLASPAIVIFMSISNMLDRLLPLLVQASATSGSGADGLALVMIAATVFAIFTAIIVGLAFGLLALSQFIEERARERASRAYQSVANEDGRPPILFLRAFRIDRHSLPGRPQWLPLRLMNLRNRYTSLDDALLSEATGFGPVLGFGSPDEDSTPIGAARQYVAHDSWQEIITDLAKASSQIVMVLDKTEGVHWEIDMILRHDLQDKTLFLTNPMAEAGVRAELMRNLAQRLGRTDMPTAGEIIALRPANGGCEVMTADDLHFDAYCIAMSVTLLDRFQTDVV